MFNRIIFQRVVLFVLILSAIAVFGVVAFRYPTTEVPIVRTKVPAGQVVEAKVIGSMTWPLNAVFPGMATSADQLIGKTALVTLDPNVPLVTNAVGEGQVRAVDPRFPKAAPEDLNKLKFFFAVDLRRAAGGVILPGDYVNIVQSNPGENMAAIVLQKVHVVGARNTAGQDTPGILPAPSSAPAGRPAGKASLAVSGYMLSLTPTQVVMIASYDISQLILVPTSIDAPDLPGIPSGLESADSPFVPQNPAPIVP